MISFHFPKISLVFRQIAFFSLNKFFGLRFLPLDNHVEVLETDKMFDYQNMTKGWLLCECDFVPLSLTHTHLRFISSMTNWLAKTVLSHKKRVTDRSFATTHEWMPAHWANCVIVSVRHLIHSSNNMSKDHLNEMNASKEREKNTWID